MPCGLACTTASGQVSKEKDVKGYKAETEARANWRHTPEPDHRVDRFPGFGGVGGVYGYRYATAETKVEVPVAKSSDMPSS